MRKKHELIRRNHSGTGCGYSVVGLVAATSIHVVSLGDLHVAMRVIMVTVALELAGLHH